MHIKYFTISKWPTHEAICKGVSPILFLTFLSQPILIKYFTIFKWPYYEAIYNGVYKRLFLVFLSK